ncbi:MAG: DUF1972 domain-containing protein [Flavobacteriales bacterium]|nr:DUF1972 domain-containing protein [Flavobacteriales bacterium]
MRVGILGCRGIPNHYGGFGQLAEYLSVRLVRMGMKVSVYNVHNHPFQEKIWNGVDIIHCYDAEPKIGTAGQFIYDLNCILDSRKRNFDIILQLGYTSSTIWFWLMPSKAKIATNMDGLEWKRTKYSWPVQQFLKVAEWLGIVSSDLLIADSVAIQTHIKKRFSKPSEFIAYGATNFNNSNKEFLPKYGVKPYAYNMLVARMESENHVEHIIQGHLNFPETPLLVVGNTEKNKFGRKLKEKYGAYPNIVFTQGIYNIEALNNLRFFSNLYFHGHSVGGTNPSLLEAMASQSLICAHNNPFNKAVLGENAFYFSSINDIEELLAKGIVKNEYTQWIETNCRHIEEQYAWDKIASQYAQVIKWLIE